VARRLAAAAASRQASIAASKGGPEGIELREERESQDLWRERREEGERGEREGGETWPRRKREGLPSGRALVTDTLS
jgi:hypothetical protein